MLNLKSFHSEEITKSIEKYNLDKVSVVFDNDQKNTIIFFQGKSKDLVKNSKGLTSIYSEYIYDAEFEKEINAYNIYMVFLATDTFSFEDFIKIRSNTFFSKKIILNNYAGNLEDDKKNLVNRYILHNNIDLNSLSLDVIKDKNNLLVFVQVDFSLLHLLETYLF